MSIERSKDLFKPHWMIWKLFGPIHPQKHRILYFIWWFLYHSSVTFFYPLHLILGLLEVRDKSEIFKNLAINLTDLVCSIKFILIWYNLKNIYRIRDILSLLDDRIETNDEKVYFQKSVKNCKYIFYVIGTLYSGASISSELTTLFGEEKRLLYPAWLPIDWSKSATNYWIANMYQFIGISLQILTNFGNDTYPPVCLALLSGHTRLLAIRLSALGMDPGKSQDKNNKELRACIQDHKRLIELYELLQEVLSMGMFLQILGTQFNMCFTIVYLLIYAKNKFAILYYCIFLMVLLVQIFPSCYFGTMLGFEFNNLSYALFSCNWVDQDKEFKQNILIFSARCLRKVSFKCLGFFFIHLDTFFKTIKSAYSLLAIFLQVQ